MRRFVLPLLILSAAGIGYACSGDDIVISSSSGGADDGGSSSGSTSSGGSSGGSSSGDSSTCTPTCKDANTFLGCDGVEKNCVLGCLTTGTPHCGAFDPTGPATAADLSEDGLMDLALENLELDTTNGRMLRAATELRPPSADPTKESVLNGVGFRIVNGVAIIRARSIVINHGFKMKGAPSLTLVASNEIRVETTWRIPCGLVGGGVGGLNGGGDAAGSEGGKGGDGLSASQATLSGAGGGAQAANGGPGSAGGASGGTPGSAAGAARLLTAIEEVKGGGGGGGGGINTVNDKHGKGGGGGGAVVLAAGVRIVVGTATADAGASAGRPGINAGGCGGESGSLEDSSPIGAGAGGGAGGLIVLEAPEVTGSGNSGIAANGGGGGSGSYGTYGRDGRIDAERAPGGDPPNESPVCSDRGGKGGAGTTPIGTNGEVLSVSCGTTNTARRGAGGGGSAGFIRVRTKPGTTATFGGGFIISPSVADAYAAGTLIVQ